MMCDILPYLRSARQTGRTTALACAAQMIGAIFVTASEDHRMSIKRQFPGLDVRSAQPTYFVGEHKPIILDHLVVEMMIGEALGSNQAVKAKKYDKIKRIVDHVLY